MFETAKTIMIVGMTQGIFVNIKKLGLYLSLMLISCVVKATDLLETYYEALDNDPIFKSAYSQFLADSQSISNAWSTMLPQLTVNALFNRVYTEVLAGVNIDVNRTYSQSQFNFQASQTIFNYKLWSLLEQARVNVRASLANFNDNAQNLMLRSSKMYFDILLAEDNLHTAEVQRNANKRQLEQAQERFNVGLDPITTIYQAKAAYNQSIALVVSAQNNVIGAKQNLSKLTNHTYNAIAALKNREIPLVYPEPMNPETWVSTSLKQNYKLIASQYYLEASRQNIKVQFSSHLPYFNLYSQGIETHNDVAALNTQVKTNSVDQLFNQIFVPQLQRNAVVGVSVSLPVFQGGLAVSKTKEAEFQFMNMSNQLENVRREVIANTNITYYSITTGIEKVKADRATLSSQRVSLDSIQEQYQVGTKTITDVLFAQQQYYQTQFQYNADQYNLITQILQLKYLAGSLDVRDLQEINTWLATSQIKGLSPDAQKVLDTLLHPNKVLP